MKFRVNSRTTRGWYVVTTNHAGGALHCTCEGYKNRQTCWHATAVELNPSAYALEEIVDTLSHVPEGFKPLPMLAKPWSGKITRNDYAVEEKFDGHRAIVQVKDGVISAWSRTGIDCLKKFSAATRRELVSLAGTFTMILDGELRNVKEGAQSYDVSHLQADDLIYHVFDVLQLELINLTTSPYDTRRSYLITLFAGRHEDTPHVQLVQAFNPQSDEELQTMIGDIWSRGGEGVIVKRRRGTYAPGKRTDSFAKWKQCERSTLRIVGFEESKGEKNYRGTHATIVLQDEEGNRTTVKTRGDELCRRLEREGDSNIGRNVMIEYHQRTADGGYREPRFDRFEDE